MNRTTWLCALAVALSSACGGSGGETAEGAGGSPAGGSAGGSSGNGAPPSANAASGTVGTTSIEIEGSSIGRIQQSGSDQYFSVQILPGDQVCSSLTLAPDAQYMELFVQANDGKIAPGIYDASNAHIEAYVWTFDANCDDQSVAKSYGSAKVELVKASDAELVGTFEVQMVEDSVIATQAVVAGEFAASICDGGGITCQ